MRMIKLLTLLICSAVLSSQAYAEERLAILEFRNIGKAMDASEVGYIAEIFRDLGAKIGRRGLSIMTKENILQLLPPGKTLEQCQGECEVETGRNIGADFVLSGEVRKLPEGLGYRLTAKIHQTRNGTLLSSEIYEGVTFKQLESDIRSSTTKDVFRAIRTGIVPSEFKEKSFGEKPGAVQGWESSSAIVQFDTDPKGAFVEVDGTVVCQQTPCSKELSLGRHEVAFKMIQYFSMTEELTVAVGMKPVLRVLKPNFGVLVLKTDPAEGFEVFLDGQSIGKTPLAPTRLDPRPHKLVVKNERYYEKGIEFKPELGAIREISLRPDPKMGALRITAEDPKGNDVEATVTIGGATMGTTPYQATLAIGSYDISVSASSGAWQQRHEVKLNDKAHLVAKLRPVPQSERNCQQELGCEHDQQGMEGGFRRDPKEQSKFYADFWTYFGLTGVVLSTALAYSEKQGANRAYSDYQSSNTIAGTADARHRVELHDKKAIAILYAGNGVSLVAICYGWLRGRYIDKYATDTKPGVSGHFFAAQHDLGFTLRYGW